MVCLGLKDRHEMDVGGDVGVGAFLAEDHCNVRPLSYSQCSAQMHTNRERTELDCIGQPLPWGCELEICVSGWLSLTQAIICDEYGHWGRVQHS